MKTVGAEGFDHGEAIAKCSYTHEAVIDHIIKNPADTQKQIAEVFGYSVGWMSRIIASDAFQARLAQRKAQLVDPRIKSAVNARLESMVIQSMDVVSRKLDTAESADLALEALGIASKALQQK